MTSPGGRGVEASRLGGEGTGWATYFPFDWQTNVNYRLCVRIAHEGANTVYLAYFFDPAKNAWKHLVTIPRAVSGGTLGGMDSFVEDFGAHCEWARSYLVGNVWVRQFNGQWADLQTNRLSCEGVAVGDCQQTNYDADVVAPYWIRLETGDHTVNDTPSGSLLARGQGTRPTLLPDESNHSPSANNAAFSVLTNSPCRGRLTAEDEDGSTIEFAAAVLPSHGSVLVQADGQFTYWPAPGFQGADRFAFRVRDPQGGASTGQVSLVVVPRIAPVEKTGQTNSFRTGDDGHAQRGVPPAVPRFTDHHDGTVTDNNTGLIWLKHASVLGVATWSGAIDLAHTLASGMAGLQDGSAAGDWRLPNDKELLSLLDYGGRVPLLPSGHPFEGVVPGNIGPARP